MVGLNSQILVYFFKFCNTGWLWYPVLTWQRILFGLSLLKSQIYRKPTFYKLQCNKPFFTWVLFHRNCICCWNILQVLLVHILMARRVFPQCHMPISIVKCIKYCCSFLFFHIKEYFTSLLFTITVDLLGDNKILLWKNCQVCFWVCIP